MAPLPPNNTPRLWLTYVTGNHAGAQQHDLLIRYNAASNNPESVMASFVDVLEGFGAAAFRLNWRVIAARVAGPLSDFSVPIPVFPALAAFVGTNDPIPAKLEYEAIEDVLVGRSTISGRRWRLSLYRANGPIDTTFRYGMPLAVQTALAAMLTDEKLTCIDGSLPVIYTYVNQNYNSYWEGELRS